MIESPEMGSGESDDLICDLFRIIYPTRDPDLGHIINFASIFYLRNYCICCLVMNHSVRQKGKSVIEKMYESSM